MKVMKYNPAFLTEQELIEKFVVRNGDLEVVIDTVEDNISGSNQHLLIIGPRGSGKTTLVLRACAEVNNRPNLKTKWFPLTFGEESYEVTSAGEFWLQALNYLGNATEDPTWDSVYQDLRRELDDSRLRRLALDRLLEFADQEQKRILLVVENFNLILGEQISQDDAWSLRHDLMNHTELMLLGTAVSRFQQIDNSNHAMYELFKIHFLKPLGTADFQAIWLSVTGQEITERRARAINVLTGGSPRLITIVASFGALRSFRSLMEDLTYLVDDYTDYFKSIMEALPPKERKVFSCLASIWQDATASEVAEAARMNTSQVSAQIARLVKRGAVQVVTEKGGKKTYQLTERLFNIYYLMRQARSDEHVDSVVDFMIHYYGPDRIHMFAKDLGEDACKLDPESRITTYKALDALLRRPEIGQEPYRLLASLPAELFELSDIPRSLLSLKMAQFVKEKKSPTEFEALISKAIILAEKGNHQEAQELLSNATRIEPENPIGWSILGFVLFIGLDRPQEAEECLRKVLVLAPEDPNGWINLGFVLANKLERPLEAEECLRKAVDISPKNTRALSDLGWILADKLDRPKEAEEYLRKAVELGPKDQGPWVNLAGVLTLKLDRPKEAEECLRKAVELDPEDPTGWMNLGRVLAYELDRPKEAEECLRKAVELDPAHPFGWRNLGRILAFKLDRPKEAEECLRKATGLEPDNPVGWRSLGRVLAFKLDRPKEAEECLRKAVELDSEHPFGWMNLGRVLAFKLDRPKEGEECLRKAVKLDPDDPNGWMNLGRVLAIELDRPIEAEECLRKVVELDPDGPNGWMNLGRVLAIKLDRPQEAEEYLRKAVELDPDDPNGWMNLAGVLAIALDRPKEAEECLRKVVELDPDDPNGWRNLGRVLAFELDRPKEAEECLRKAVKLEPNNPIGWKILGRVLAIELDRPKEAEEYLRKGTELDQDDYDSFGLYIAVQASLGKNIETSLAVYMEQNKRSADALNNLACTFMSVRLYDYLPKVEAWAQEALESGDAKQKKLILGTLARALAMQGKAIEALQQEAKIINEPDIIKMDIKEAADIFTAATAVGQGKRALDMIRSSASARVLEPLAVGIAQYLDLKPRAPQEVKEIGKDIVDQIKKWEVFFAEK